MHFLSFFAMKVSRSALRAPMPMFISLMDDVLEVGAMAFDAGPFSSTVAANACAGK